MTRRLRHLFLLAIAAAILIPPSFLVAAPSASTAATARACGIRTFRQPNGMRVRLAVGARLIACATARRIAREYWTAPDSRLKIIISAGQDTGSVLLKRYPGWACKAGNRAGRCARGARQATWALR
jgi:hypothetical protein